MSSKLLLLISPHEEDKAFAAEVAIAAGLSLHVSKDAFEAVSILDRDRPAIVFADASRRDIYDKLEGAIQSTLGLFSDSISNNTFHFLGDKCPDQSDYILKSPLFGNLIQRNFGDIQKTGSFYGRIVAATLKDRVWGLKNLFKAEAKVQTIPLQSSSQKQSAVEAVRGYLVKAKFQTRMANLIANAVDEILMNAMFDAPVDATGKQIYSQTARSTVIKLDGKAAVEMQVGFDGEVIGITVADNWGSIDKTKLIGHLSKVYTEEDYQVRTSVAGAGLGLATIYHSGASFIFASESGTKSEVTVFFRKIDTFKDFRDQFHFLMSQFYF